MDAIVLTLDVGEDHRLIIDLPADTPPGKVNVVITAYQANATHTNPAREAARAKLLAAGALSTYFVPDDKTPISDEEIEALWRKFDGGTSIDQIIDQERGSVE